MVAALAGLARAGGGEEPFEEALHILEGSEYDFAMGMLSAGSAFLELALAAQALGREEKAREFAARARSAGSRRALD